MIIKEKIYIYIYIFKKKKKKKKKKKTLKRYIFYLKIYNINYY